MEDNNSILASGPRRAWFVALVAYYVLALYLVPSSAQVKQFSFIYFMHVIPAWLYVVGNWRYLFTGYNLASKSMALFAILAGLVGLLRWDISLTYNAVFLAAMTIVILNSRVYVTAAELNWLFFVAMIGSVVVYNSGITIYGFLPGQAEALRCHAAMNWRISLFRVPAESAMFSFVILIVNIIYGDRLLWWVRGLAILMATYFLIFSGIRSIVFPALIVVPICALIVLYRKGTKARRHAVIGIIVGAMAILSVPYWLGKEDGFWENYFLRTKECDYLYRYGHILPSGELNNSIPLDKSVPSDWYSWTFNRHCTAIYQLSLLARSPMGNKDLQPKSNQQLIDIGCPSDQLRTYCTSCNFNTYWLARAGLSAIPLLLCFAVLIIGAVKSRSLGQFALLGTFFIVGLSWGVMYVPYNVIFLLLLAIPAFTAAHERHRKGT